MFKLVDFVTQVFLLAFDPEHSRVNAILRTSATTDHRVSQWCSTLFLRCGKQTCVLGFNLRLVLIGCVVASIIKISLDNDWHGGIANESPGDHVNCRSRHLVRSLSVTF